MQASLEKRLDGERLRQGESHSPVHSPGPDHSSVSEQVRRRVEFDRANSPSACEITATVDNRSNKSADASSAKTKIKVDDASRRSHAHVKHRASHCQSIHAAETDDEYSFEEKARASRRMGRDNREGRPSLCSRSNNTMKPPTFSGTDIAVKTFRDKFKACATENRWTDERSWLSFRTSSANPLL